MPRRCQHVGSSSVCVVLRWLLSPRRVGRCGLVAVLAVVVPVRCAVVVMVVRVLAVVQRRRRGQRAVLAQVSPAAFSAWEALRVRVRLCAVTSTPALGGAGVWWVGLGCRVSTATPGSTAPGPVATGIASASVSSRTALLRIVAPG